MQENEKKLNSLQKVTKSKHFGNQNNTIRPEKLVFAVRHKLDMASFVRYESEKYFLADNKKVAFPSIFDKATIDLSVIVPAYNEEKRLPKMLVESLEHLEAKQKQNPKYEYEIIIVDDGSSDKTTEVGLGFTEKYGPSKVRVLTLFKNRGKGGAVRLGMMSARGRKLLMVDGDGATRFSDLDKVEAKLDEITTLPKESAIAVGSRAHLEEEAIANRSVFRTFLMKGFHLLVWLLCVRTVRDTQCGFKLLTRSAAVPIFTNLHVERWAFDVEMLYIAENLHIPVVEVAVVWTEIEGSKIVPVLSWIQMGKDIFLIWLHYFLGLWSIKASPE
uniref:Dolichyl-phosphate beta-glucosyltransferase n=1 Tax=Phallusia mammillata TaxID=59560 RepID=A0A6F9D5P6_9ASCI|nr:dolichyl-phosphate beta-glucosyltransferase-like [Phallusia mammillata]